MTTRRVAQVIAAIAGSIVSLWLTASANAAPPPIKLAPAAYYATGQSFDSPSADDTGTAVADLNGDGKPDVVAVDQWEATSVVVQYNKGDGTFTSPGQVITVGNFGVENVVTGKFTSSGRNDVVILTGSGFYFARNNGGGSFTVGPFHQLQQAPFQDTAVAADFNRDGKLDLAVKTPAGIQMELGNGDGTFQTGPLTTVPGVPGGIAAISLANINGDGIHDLFAADAGSQQIFALTGNGDGGFTVSTAGIAPFVPGTVEAVRDTANGLDSAVATDEFNAPGTSAALLVNNGNGTFGSPKLYDGGINPIAGAVGDLNGDGIPDVVSSDTSGSQQVILAGDGNGGLVQAGTFPTGTFPQDPVVADFNGDGKPDIAVTAFCPNTLTGASCLAVLINKS